eukprot:7382913-Prymnesium_polylepis.2
MSVVPKANHTGFEQPVFFRFLQANASAVAGRARPGTLYFDTFYYVPSWCDSALADCVGASYYYTALLDAHFFWQRTWEAEQPMELELPARDDTSGALLAAQAKHALVLDMITRHETVWPRYGTEPGYADGGGVGADGFQETFTASMMAALEWGAFRYARAVLENYASCEHLPPGFELRPVGTSLSRHTRVVAHAALHHPPRSVTLRSIVQASHPAADRLPAAPRGGPVPRARDGAAGPHAHGLRPLLPLHARRVAAAGALRQARRHRVDARDTAQREPRLPSERLPTRHAHGQRRGRPGLLDLLAPDRGQRASLHLDRGGDVARLPRLWRGAGGGGAHAARRRAAARAARGAAHARRRPCHPPCPPRVDARGRDAGEPWRRHLPSIRGRSQRVWHAACRRAARPAEQ